MAEGNGRMTRDDGVIQGPVDLPGVDLDFVRVNRGSPEQGERVPRLPMERDVGMDGLAMRESGASVSLVVVEGVVEPFRGEPRGAERVQLSETIRHGDSRKDRCRMPGAAGRADPHPCRHDAKEVERRQALFENGACEKRRFSTVFESKTLENGKKTG
jgi:hypothetical protein